MSHATARIAFLATMLAVLCLVISPTRAHAFTGDWSLSGSFERTTTPSFAGGFNPNDLDQLVATYDNRAKQFSLQLSFFEVPSRGDLQVAFGTSQQDGSCTADTLQLMITARDVLTTREIVEAERYWVAGQERYTFAYTWPGTGWVYLGFEAWRSQHHWSKPGAWAYRNTTHIVTEPETSQYERSATLERSGVDGSLVSVAQFPSSATTMRWMFGSPLLSGVVADCVELYVPSRNAPFVITSPVAPAPLTPSPVDAPATAPPAGTDEIDLTEIVVTAVRRGTKIDLRLLGGDAAQIGIRVRRASRTIDFRSRITLRNQPITVRSVSVRFSDGAEWSDWERVLVR